jgi:hypothetical protein
MHLYISDKPWIHPSIITLIYTMHLYIFDKPWIHPSIITLTYILCTFICLTNPGHPPPPPLPSHRPFPLRSTSPAVGPPVSTVIRCVPGLTRWCLLQTTCQDSDTKHKKY